MTPASQKEWFVNYYRLTGDVQEVSVSRRNQPDRIGLVGEEDGLGSPQKTRYKTMMKVRPW